MVGTNDGVFVATPNVIYARLELNDIVDMRSIFHRPVHTTANPTQRILPAAIAAGQLLEYRDHAIWIETSIRKVDFGVDAKLQLAALLRRRRVDSRASQALEMVLTLSRINHMNCLVATLEPVFYEWKQDPVLFIIVIEESADVTRLFELGTSKRNGSRILLHAIYPTGCTAPQSNAVQ